MARQHNSHRVRQAGPAVNGATSLLPAQTKAVSGYPGASSDPLLIGISHVGLSSPWSCCAYVCSNARVSDNQTRVRGEKASSSMARPEDALFRILRQQMADEALVMQSNSMWLASLLLALMARFFEDSATAEAQYLSSGAVEKLLTNRHQFRVPVAVRRAAAHGSPFSFVSADALGHRKLGRRVRRGI